MKRFAAVFLAAVAGADASALETTDCLIQPSQTVEVGGAIPGQLSDVMVEVNDHVTKGDPIAVFQQDVQATTLALARFRAENMAAIESARARVEYEKKQLERAETLRERGVATAADIDERRTTYEISLRDLEEAQANMGMAELEAERASAELAIRTIVAPINGIVADRFKDPGEYLRDDAAVVVLVAVDPLLVEIFLGQDDYDAISPEQVATIWSELTPDVPLTARVVTRDVLVDPASATFRVRLELANPDGAIIPGVRCRARIGEDG